MKDYEYASTPSNQNVVSFEYYNFGIEDKKGRTIGMQVEIQQLELVPITDSHVGCFYPLEQGIWFQVRAHVTRDGKAYGAVQARHYFRTLEEATVYSAKRVEASKTAASRKA